MLTQKQKTTFIYATPAVVLSILFIIDGISKDFYWSSRDFGIAAFLLFGTAILIDVIRRIVKGTMYKILAFSVIMLLLILVWAELAVGIFGTSVAGN
ncbi:hypothetical protein [Chryseobacterium wangxinyae]|uniref:hypothetical protein n=1 Tax=Chryseobacterium sp. CY353 TaxID=2997334 RepID=UPI00226FCB86|nr:hypothetical protein [Chryseobacterium sp. CY353]MCY0970907.1 hypothetical protein [Chryseobacterium sp. CY353]